MNGELYVRKGMLFASKGEFEKAVEAMNRVLELEEDEVAVTEAHCFLGEYYFAHREYEKSAEHLDWISERTEELESRYDDLLNEEIATAEVLLSLMENRPISGRRYHVCFGGRGDSGRMRGLGCRK